MFLVQCGQVQALKFKKWTEMWADKDLMKKYKEALPKGQKLIGVYAVVAGSANYDYEVWFEIDNYAVLDQRENPAMEAVMEEAFTKYGYVFEGREEWRFLRTLDDLVMYWPKALEE